MANEAYQQYLEHFESRLEEINASSVFIIDTASSTSSKNYLSEEEGRVIFKQYYEQSRDQIIIQNRAFKYIDAVQESEDSHFYFLYIYINPENSDDKRICIVTQLAENILYGIEAAEINKLEVLGIMHNMFD